MGLESSDLNSIYSDTVWYKPGVGSGSTCTDSPGTFSGTGNEEIAWNYFINRGLKPVQTAAILGNLKVESGIDPQKVQGGGESTVNPLDGHTGWGLAQWTDLGRQKNLQAFADNDPQKRKVYSIELQLDFIWHEASSGNVIKTLKTLTDLQAAVDYWMNTYERPDASSAHEDKRLGGAQDSLTNFGSTPPSDGQVSVTQASCTGPAASTTSDTGIIGQGSGSFTTNATAAAYPGLNTMLAYVKKVAQTAPGALPQATQDFCALMPGGTCTFHCESAVEEIWLGHRGVYPNPNTAWPIIKAAGHAHPADRNPPIGALLFYTAAGDVNGHIAVYLGKNLVFSTDVLKSGSVYIASADKIEVAGWNMTYVGWSDPYFSGVVGKP